MKSIQKHFDHKITSTQAQSKTKDIAPSSKNRFQSVPASKRKPPQVPEFANHTVAPTGRLSINEFRKLPSIIPSKIKDGPQNNKENVSKAHQTNKIQTHESQQCKVPIKEVPIVSMDQIAQLENKIMQINQQIEILVNNNNHNNHQFVDPMQDVQERESNQPASSINNQGKRLSLIKEEECIQSDETLSWLMSSVDYGKYKENKLQILKLKQNDESSKLKDAKKPSDVSLTENLERLQKLFTFYNQNDDLELKQILKEEIERLLKESINQSNQLEITQDKSIKILDTQVQNNQVSANALSQETNLKPEIREFKTEVRLKKRKRREVFTYEEDNQWLSFSSGDDEDASINHQQIPPDERGDSRFNFPKTDVKNKYKFFNFDSEHKGPAVKIQRDTKMRKLNDQPEI